MTKAILFVGALLCATLAQISASALAASGLDAFPAEDRAAIGQIESYLNGITSMQARFVQRAANGGQATGSLYIERPGKMRVEYDPPVPILIVSTGVLLILFDAELGQTTHLPIEASPASVLIRDAISFGKEVEVLGFAREDGLVRLTLGDEGGLGMGTGQITLEFFEDPLELRRWTVVDAEGQTTSVSLLDPRYGVNLDPVLFKFVDPTADKNRGNR
ncbi:MAG: outer membrane lipoprotein carrier protein LolA [Rhodospirillaceae bacterium]|jgi:outer membrane lipoprotein-sorting protein|nr:outer membrane lipoprotein carrier protein LolA [Rhodospirillaceae bacterium]